MHTDDDDDYLDYYTQSFPQDNPSRRWSASTTSSADATTVYYSLDGLSNDSRTPPGGASDDDVPLAQRVPTALSAQKSIRRQLHDERQLRKLERAKTSRPDPPLPPPVPARSRKRSVSAAPAPASVPVEPFPVQDLTRKLLSLQSGSLVGDPSPRLPPYSTAVSRSSSRGRHTDQSLAQQKLPRLSEVSERSLRSARSFHRPAARHSETHAIDHTSASRLARSATAATRPGRDAHEHPPKSARPSDDIQRPLPRSSVDDPQHRPVQRPPVPPIPPSPPHHVPKGPVVQQRIFIGDMQRFNMVEIMPTTNARDVIDTVANQGLLDKSLSWMVFELAQDYGMERPIRDYELLADVSASWNKDKLLNAFVIKQTPLAQLLSRAALPTSSPMYRGWVEWESKRGKWTKRWMELREHGIWLSKRDTGKDEAFLCSLSNFDAYLVTRRHKAPKPFVFAIKSTDHLSLFENAADYLHVFSCNPKDGEKWMQAILVARSYVLYQERNVLFAKTGESLSQGKPLARSRTRKQSVSRPAQPLVNVPPPYSQATTANVAFEPGSLLAKRKEV